MLSFQKARAYDNTQVPQDAGLTQWGTNLVDVLMNGPGQLTDALARQIGSELLGGETKPTFVTDEVIAFPLMSIEFLGTTSSNSVLPLCIQVRIRL
jgi:hypothetical protein